MVNKGCENTLGGSAVLVLVPVLVLLLLLLVVVVVVVAAVAASASVIFWKGQGHVWQSLRVAIGMKAQRWNPRQCAASCSPSSARVETDAHR